MSHLAFRDGRAGVALEADYVVVGSGPGGATAALELARVGQDVTLVEAGAWRTPAQYPSTCYGALRDVFDAFGTSFVRGRAFWPVVQGAAVGGSTVINSAICVRTPGDVFEAWQRDHGIGGDAMAEEVWQAQEELERELHAAPTAPGSLGRSNELVQAGAEGVGYGGHIMQRYARACEGTGQCMQGCRASRKQSLDLTFVPELLRQGGRLVSCAPVRRVLLEGARATGVAGRFRHPQTRRRGSPFRIRARRAVIVAASATHSPALLQRSGLRSPALGQGFRAHPGTGIFGRYEEPVDMNIGVSQGWASTAFREDGGFKLETLSIPPELVACRFPGAGYELVRRLASYRQLAMWAVAVRADHSVGTVRSGLGGQPVVRFTMAPEDMARLRAGALVLARTHLAAGARSVLCCVHGLPWELGPGDLHLLEHAPLDPRAWVGILSHLFGGCVMGSNPARSVCDGEGRVHGHDGLVIADASVIPTTLGVNPQHTIMALARHFAQRLLDRTAA